MIADAEAAVLGCDGMPAVVTPSGLPKPPDAQVDECSGADCCAAQVPNVTFYLKSFGLLLIYKRLLHIPDQIEQTPLIWTTNRPPKWGFTVVVVIVGGGGGGGWRVNNHVK